MAINNPSEIDKSRAEGMKQRDTSQNDSEVKGVAEGTTRKIKLIEGSRPASTSAPAKKRVNSDSRSSFSDCCASDSGSSCCCADSDCDGTPDCCDASPCD